MEYQQALIKSLETIISGANLIASQASEAIESLVEEGNDVDLSPLFEDISTLEMQSNRLRSYMTPE